MPNKIDLTGRRFGMLTVVYQEPTRNTRVSWRCRCDCGLECVKPGKELLRSERRGWTDSCGCQIQRTKAILAQFSKDDPHLQDMHDKRRTQRAEKRLRQRRILL